MADDVKPIRVQLSRAKGWRMPENTVKVDRTTRWGNPYRAGQPLAMAQDDGAIRVRILQSNADLVAAFRQSALSAKEIDPARYAAHVDYIRRELKGKNLACWCSLREPCHADVLLEIANG